MMPAKIISTLFYAGNRRSDLPVLQRVAGSTVVRVFHTEDGAGFINHSPNVRTDKVLRVAHSARRQSEGQTSPYYQAQHDIFHTGRSLA